MEEVILAKEFDINIRIQREDQEDLVITENGLQLKFDLGMALQNCPPDPHSRYAMMGAYLTTRWKEKLGELTISGHMAFEVWKSIAEKSKELKKNSTSEQRLLEKSQS